MAAEITRSKNQSLDATGDAHFSSGIAVSYSEEESKLTENFRTEMEKYQRLCDDELKPRSWSYTEAFNSLQKIMESEETTYSATAKCDKDGRGTIESNKEHSTACDNENTGADRSVDYDPLLDSVTKLLDSVYLKYSTLMLDGKGTIGARNCKENDSNGKLELFENPNGELGLEKAQKSPGVFSNEAKSINSEGKKRKNHQIPQKPSAELNDSYSIKVTESEIHVLVPEEDQQQKIVSKVQKAKTKGMKMQYPHSNWQPVEDSSPTKEQNENLTREELLKELRECDEKLKELCSGDSVSLDDDDGGSSQASTQIIDDSSSETYTESDSDYDEDHNSFGADNGYDYGDFHSNTDYHQGDYSYSQHGYPPGTSGFAVPPHPGTSYTHSTHAPVTSNWFSPSNDVYTHWYNNFWTNPYNYPPAMGEAYVEHLKQYQQYYEQSAKYYSDLAKSYQANNSLEENYHLQKSYIDKMLKKK